MTSATAAELQPVTPSPGPAQYSNVAPPSQLRTPEVDFGGGARTVATPDEVEPLSAERRRVHVNVSKEFVKKLKTARAGLSHSVPGATVEQVLEAGLDLLLEKQARARGQVKRPRTTLPAATPRGEGPVGGAAGAHDEAMRTRNDDLAATSRPSQQPSQPLALLPTAPPTTVPRPPRREGPRETIPAAVRRAVWERDGDHCSWPLDGGGCCGSTHRLELDHVIPWAEWGPSTVENLRVVCHRHNALAARQVFGERCAVQYSRAPDRRSTGRPETPGRPFRDERGTSRNALPAADQSGFAGAGFEGT
jgi:hypothetical protein